MAFKVVYVAGEAGFKVSGFDDGREAFAAAT